MVTGGPDPEVPEHGELGKAGGRGGPAGCLSSGNILTWLQRGRGLRAVSQAGRIRPDGAGRVQHESRRLAEATLSTAAGTADLRERPVGEDSPAHLVSAPPTCSNPWILPFTLRNPNNLCYLNSFVHSAALLERHTRCVLLPHSFRDPGARLLDAHHLLKFHLLGWRHPAEQHDVVELIDHLLPRLQPQHARYTWSARQGLGEGIRVHSRAELTRCLPLSNSAIDTPDLQRIISRWHIQDTCNALDSPAPWLFMQLPWGELAAFGLITTKNHNPVILPQVVRLPVFSSACSLDLRWHDYRVVACILHHGERLTAGHYNVVSLGGLTPHVLDDAKSAFPATTAFLESASCTALCARAHSWPPNLESRQPLQLKTRVLQSAMTEETNTFLLRKYGDGWTAAHLSLLEFHVKDLEAQMMNMQRYVDSLHAQLHSLQLLVHRHSYLYSTRNVNKSRPDKVRYLNTLDD